MLSSLLASLALALIPTPQTPDERIPIVACEPTGVVTSEYMDDLAVVRSEPQPVEKFDVYCPPNPTSIGKRTKQVYKNYITRTKRITTHLAPTSPGVVCTDTFVDVQDPEVFLNQIIKYTADTCPDVCCTLLTEGDSWHFTDKELILISETEEPCPNGAPGKITTTTTSTYAEKQLWNFQIYVATNHCTPDYSAACADMSFSAPKNDDPVWELVKTVVEVDEDCPSNTAETLLSLTWPATAVGTSLLPLEASTGILSL